VKGLAIGWMTRVCFLAEIIIILFTIAPEMALGSTTVSVEWYCGFLSGVRWLEGDTNH
jgi:hypothetical protein